MPEVELTLNAPVNTNGNTGSTIAASILVIDDEASIRESLEVLLSLEGYTTAMAVDGEEGLRMLESNSYDLVLLDLAMPGQSGLEILQRRNDRILAGPEGGAELLLESAVAVQGCSGAHLSGIEFDFQNQGPGESQENDLFQENGKDLLGTLGGEQPQGG